MELVKKNILSIICGVVALAAIVFHLVFTSGQFTALEEQGKARSEKLGTVTGLLGEQRAFPAVRDDAVPPKLDRFPNPPTIAVAESLASKLHAEATRLMTKAVEINRTGYDLLIPNSLPRPTDPQKLFFRGAYNAVLARGGQPKAYDGAAQPLVNLPDGVLRSAVPPTDAEIVEAKRQLWRDTYAPKIILQNNQVVNRAEVVAEYTKAIANFDEEFRRKRAQDFKVYLEPEALKMNPRLVIGSRVAAATPSVDEMWYGQMSFWVQQDVCRAIARMNDPFPNIPAAPVKHLITVDVKQDATMYVNAGGAAAPAAAEAPPEIQEGSEGAVDEEGNPIEAPPPPPPDPAAAAAAAPPVVIPKNYAVSSTGRVCNPMYDVVHFDLVVVVDAGAVKEFLRQLQYGRFINVTFMEMQSVDLGDAVDVGYDYGRRPVVELTVKCEALFLREWTVQNNGPMPATVRAALGIGPAGAPAAPPPAAAVD